MYYINNDKTTKTTLEKLVIEETKLNKVLFLCHNESGCHLGQNKTNAKISVKYYFPGKTEKVKEYISKCDECQKQNKKAKTTVPKLQSVPCGSRIWGKIGIDLIGPFLDSNKEPVSENGYR